MSEEEASTTPFSLSDEDKLKTEASLNEIAERATDCAALVEALNLKLKSKEMSTAEVNHCGT